jgi:hypothetical protein
MLFTIVLLLLVALARASAPVPPQNEHEIDSYVDTHGKTLFEEFARAQIASKHNREPHQVSDETVQHTAGAMFKRLATKGPAEKVRYLTGMQKKIEILKAGI